MSRGRTGKSAPKGALKAKPRPAGKRAKKGAAPTKATALFDDEEPPADDAEEELPKDEAGRRKIKRQYEELLGIRIEKLKGRILNRERINKTIEGIYFICASCRKICHNLDEGLVEDPNNMNNLCHACANVKEPRGGKASKTAAA
jgi:hypothetical protein